MRVVILHLDGLTKYNDSLQFTSQLCCFYYIVSQVVVHEVSAHISVTFDPTWWTKVAAIIGAVRERELHRTKDHFHVGGRHWFSAVRFETNVFFGCSVFTYLIQQS